MGFKDEMSEAFTEMRDTLGAEQDHAPFSIRYPVTKAGADAAGVAEYEVIPSPTPDRLELIEGGFLADYQFSMLAKVDDFPSAPVVGTLLLKDNRVSRILSVEASEASPFYLLHCGTPEK